MSKPEERVIRRMLEDVVNEVVTDSRADRLVRVVGDSVEDQAENVREVNRRLVAAVMAVLRSADLVAPDRYRPDTSKVVDKGLYDNLKDGFDEGREGDQQGKEPDESSTKPEQYEQLQLPGMEKY